MEKIRLKIEGIDWVLLGGKLMSAFLLLVVGLWVVNLLSKSIAKLMDIKKFDKSLKGFVLSTLTIICKGIILLSAAATLGLDLSMLSTIIAASALAIGMALQGSLSNIAGGALIMVFRPFRVGDFIEAQGHMGIVKQIELFTTKLNTTDNKEVILPNGILSNGSVINYSSEDKRRVDIIFGVAYDSDLKQTKAVLSEAIKSFDGVLEDPTVRVSELGDSSVNFITKTWVSTTDYWDAYHHILEEGKLALDKAGIEIPYPTSVEISK